MSDEDRMPAVFALLNHVATIEIAKAEFEASWKQRETWAGLEKIA